VGSFYEIQPILDRSALLEGPESGDPVFGRMRKSSKGMDSRFRRKDEEEGLVTALHCVLAVFVVQRKKPFTA
jgi:hypothetical protein